MRFSSNEQSIRNILLLKSFLALLSVSECHLPFMLKFYGELYTPTPIYGYTLKCVTADSNVFFLIRINVEIN